MSEILVVTDEVKPVDAAGNALGRGDVAYWYQILATPNMHSGRTGCVSDRFNCGLIRHESNADKCFWRVSEPLRSGRFQDFDSARAAAEFLASECAGEAAQVETGPASAGESAAVANSDAGGSGDGGAAETTDGALPENDGGVALPDVGDESPSPDAVDDAADNVEAPGDAGDTSKGRRKRRK